MAMLASSRPVTPQRAQTMPESSSPAGSQKDSAPSWWIAAKNRLTPTKEPLTPAQQIVLDTKEREKKEKKGGKQKDKAKEKSLDDWQPSSDINFSDPSLLNLNLSIPLEPLIHPLWADLSPFETTATHHVSSLVAARCALHPRRCLERLSLTMRNERSKD